MYSHTLDQPDSIATERDTADRSDDRPASAVTPPPRPNPTEAGHEAARHPTARYLVRGATTGLATGVGRAAEPILSQASQRLCLGPSRQRHHVRASNVRIRIPYGEPHEAVSQGSVIAGSRIDQRAQRFSKRGATVSGGRRYPEGITVHEESVRFVEWGRNDNTVAQRLTHREPRRLTVWRHGSTRRP